MLDKRFLWLGGLICFIGLCWLPAVSHAQRENRAGIIIQLPDGETVSRCVAFESATINGIDLLSTTHDVVLATEAFGQSVCRIDGVGCPADDCFCQCANADCAYWQYWHLTETGWTYSAIGAGSSQVQTGDVQGWVWGTSELNALPDTSFGEICAETATLYQPITKKPAGIPRSDWAQLPYVGFAGIILFLLAMLGWVQWRKNN